VNDEQTTKQNMIPQTTFPMNLNSTDRLTYFFGKHWLTVFLISYSFFVGLPFLAPAFMALGWVLPARAIYFFYSFLCHQLPERSYFLFGPQISYSLQEIHKTGQNVSNLLSLRQFIGNAQMGWKVAWSDRMVSLFTSILPTAVIWWALRKRVQKLPWWGLVLFLLPMAVDGTTHLLSDFAGIGLGFRDTNTWLAVITNQSLPNWFYAGDAWGSFNSIARLVTGALSGIGVGWFLFPLVEETFQDSIHYLEYKQRYAAFLASQNE
jgi:uncharacterized membrane protein